MKGFLFFQKPEKRSHIYPEIGDILRIFLQCSSQNLFTNHGNFPGKCQALGCYILRKTPPEQLVLQRLSAGGIRQLERLSTQQNGAELPCRLLFNRQNLPQMFFFMSLLRGISLQISCNLPPK